MTMLLLNLCAAAFAAAYIYSYWQAPWCSMSPRGALTCWAVYGLSALMLPIVIREPLWLNGLATLVWMAVAVMTYDRISRDVTGMWRPVPFRREGGEGGKEDDGSLGADSVDDLEQWLSGQG